MIPEFFYSDRILRYSFGPGHPLKPERLRRTIALLRHLGVNPLDPGPGEIGDVLRVHDADYADAVRDIDLRISGGESRRDWSHGFGSMDNPPFAGMFEASLAYVSATAAAARAVVNGAPVAFGIGGGLHHALRNRASGFCIFDDPAIACHILRERFERVAYVDIDVHHGDGVQWIFWDDPSVLTCSIHEDGRTLFPGTGFVDETGAEHSALNVPLQAKTTGDVWLTAFERTILPALERFEPGAIVLQLGTDSHRDDPLGHIRSGQSEWLSAVKRIRDLGIPIVAVGGGGYNLDTVPRMWSSAVLELARAEYADVLPEPFALEWGVKTFSDEAQPAGSFGDDFAESTLRALRSGHALLAS